MMKRPGLALLVVVPALSLGACGGGDSDKDKISSLVEDIGKDPAKLCDHATKDLLKQVGGTKESCLKAAKGAKKDRDVKVDSVKVDGDKATAKLKGVSGAQTASFVKEGGDWKIANTQ